MTCSKISQIKDSSEKRKEQHNKKLLQVIHLIILRDH